MNKHTKILIGVLAIFIVGMTLSVVFAEPVDAKTFKAGKGYKFKVPTKKAKKLKKEAYKNYKKSNMRYAYSTHMYHVKVYKPGHSYKTYFCYRYERGYGALPHLSAWPI
ncbi:MAG: hypothetical protein J6P09_07075 [Methanobrevibacter sp.]|uniref:hypothetical protein n=1 Tax=Methanobrevibacter sp. TaxID=66852 RepID=UPI001B03B07E|nr:hypothetical protein [Methanobrevibacter sp.]MBO6123586.1 hypothetical protein [Methanobrevibacter sp.]MBP3791212.1 hypothetical protein [Methanobrevibacter sp.]